MFNHRQRIEKLSYRDLGRWVFRRGCCWVLQSSRVIASWGEQVLGVRNKANVVETTHMESLLHEGLHH